MTSKAAIYTLFQFQQTFGSTAVCDIESWACQGSKLDPAEQAGAAFLAPAPVRNSAAAEEESGEGKKKSQQKSQDLFPSEQNPACRGVNDTCNKDHQATETLISISFMIFTPSRPQIQNCVPGLYLLLCSTTR